MTVLLVANDGGHIKQLHSLRRDHLDLGDDVLWATIPTPQTRSLLHGEPVHWVAPSPTRDARAVARNAMLIRPIFARRDITQVVSTGASLALAALPQAWARGIPAYFIESATRAYGPSLSGTILARFPGIRTFTQHPDWADDHWRFLASPWDRYVCVDGPTMRDPRKVVVSLGTSQTFGFRRLLERLIPLLPKGADVLWQTGRTDTSGLGIDARARVPSQELEAAMREADVVVAHAGTGIAITALEAGKCPVLVPRRSSQHEHVDNHQMQVALEVALRGLAISRDADSLSHRDLVMAASRVVTRAPDLTRVNLLDL